LLWRGEQHPGFQAKQFRFVPPLACGRGCFERSLEKGKRTNEVAGGDFG
jgi:hypothetical protein